MPCIAKKTFRGRRASKCQPDRPGQGQPADPASADPGHRADRGADRYDKGHNKGRNRDETRIATVFDASDKLADPEWRPHIKTIIQVNRRVLTRSAATGLWHRTAETAFYVSNTTLGAAPAAEAIRAHWAIENTSHYSRDVTFGEDRCRIRSNPGVFARLRSFAFNILKANRTSTISQDRYRAALGGIDNMLQLIAIPEH